MQRLIDFFEYRTPPRYGTWRDHFRTLVKEWDDRPNWYNWMQTTTSVWDWSVYWRYR